MDTLLSMKAFCGMVERESFAAAARSLGISTAKASKHVMHLEQRLGTRLLNRTSRHVSLTESGALYFERYRQMLEDLEEVESSVANVTVVPRGLLKVTAPVWLANPSFTAVLADYQAAFPEVRLDIDLSGRIVNMVEEGIDLALRVARTLGDTLVVRPIGTVLFQWVGSPDYLQRAGRPQRPADLAGHRMLMYSLLTTTAGEEFAALTGGPCSPRSSRAATSRCCTWRPCRAWAWPCCPPGRCRTTWRPGGWRWCWQTVVGWRRRCAVCTRAGATCRPRCGRSSTSFARIRGCAEHCPRPYHHASRLPQWAFMKGTVWCCLCQGAGVGCMRLTPLRHGGVKGAPEDGDD